MPISAPSRAAAPMRSAMSSKSRIIPVSGRETVENADGAAAVPGRGDAPRCSR
jgi:hypothetical protein